MLNSSASIGGTDSLFSERLQAPSSSSLELVARDSHFTVTESHAISFQGCSLYACVSYKLGKIGTLHRHAMVRQT